MSLQYIAVVFKRVSLGHNFNFCAVVRLVIITIFAVHLLTIYFLKLLNDRLLRPRLIFLFPLITSGSSVKLPKIISEELCMLAKNVYVGFSVISFCLCRSRFLAYKLEMWERWISIEEYVFLFIHCFFCPSG